MKKIDYKVKYQIYWNIYNQTYYQVSNKIYYEIDDQLWDQILNFTLQIQRGLKNQIEEVK
jgi:hypothetical protein